MIALLFAILAMLHQPQVLPQDFVNIILRCDRPTATRAFTGCRSVAPDGEIYYAGRDGRGLWITGP